MLGCTPVVNQRGYLPDPVGEASIKIGSDTQDHDPAAAGRSLDPGRPSAATPGITFPACKADRVLRPEDRNPRSILAVHFDKDGQVADIRHYGLKDGHVVAFETRETPAKGKELTFLQQLFNATPGVPIGVDRSRPKSRRRWRRPRDTRSFGQPLPRGDRVRRMGMSGPCASVASSSSATMLVILIIGLTAGPAVSL